MKPVLYLRPAFLLIGAALFAAPALGANCDDMSRLNIPNVKIDSAQLVAPGKFTPPPAPRVGAAPEPNGVVREGRGRGAAAPATPPPNPYTSLPAFCRVQLTAKPSSDSDIKIEVWMPQNGWNGKFQGVGNGGWAGVISYSAMADAVRAGYASASTDTGHVGGRGTFALDHAEKLVDFSWRSEHEMTVKAKDVIKAFYGTGPRLSYWNGCSTGGRQGLKEAQMFSDDYDGIIAGAPANRTAISLWIADAVLKDPASYIPPAKYPIIHQAALNACDSKDGLKDGLNDDPRKCDFDPKVLLCKAGDGAECLTAPQVKAAKQICSPAINPRTGKELFSSLVPGTELGWGVQAQGPEPSANIYDQYRYVVFKDANWDWKTFNFDTDVERGDRPENLIMNATDPNMKAFFSHGGKLLLYHGWSDPNVATLNTIKYYQNVVATMGGESRSMNNVRLFLEPGMGHCGGGEGPNVFDKVGPLEKWVENGKTPERLEASHSTNGKMDRTRPLCPYPQVAKYKGTGSIDEASNFECRIP